MAFPPCQKRIAAKEAGERFYSNGKLCKHGHESFRYTSNGHCVECDVTKAKQYRKDNPEKIKLVNKKWNASNKHKKVFYERKRQASQIQRTPDWLTKEHLNQIEQYYFVAKDLTQRTGIKFQVDHIVPLQGEQVSGLHVPWNLIVITQEENIRKHNKLVDFPWQTIGSGVLLGESALPWNLRKEV